MPTVTLQQLIARQAAQSQPKPHSFQQTDVPPPSPAQQDRAAAAASFHDAALNAELDRALVKIAELSARCDALLERNGRWTRYVTGD